MSDIVSKPIKICMVFSDFGPYHVARIEAFASALSENPNYKLYALRFFETSKTYGWKPVLPNNVDVVTLRNHESRGTASSLKTAYAFFKCIKQKKIDVVFLPSYSPLVNSLCVLISKMAGCKLVLMNESWEGTEKANLIGRGLKHLVVRLFDAALVGGTPQKEYACKYGLDPAKVFLGYDVVDNDYYYYESVKWTNLPGNEIPIPNLPSHYFLNLGRFVEKKNLPTLVRAYSELIRKDKSIDISLVLVGEGNEERELKELARSLNVNFRDGLETTSNGPEIVFYPFQQIEKTPIFFSRCTAFILPSIQEEWGLVINEAMACGVAVLVSKNVGCSRDLVVEGNNGFLFDPHNVTELSTLLERLVLNKSLSKTLGQNSLNHIKERGLNFFAEGAQKALSICLNI